MIKTVMCNALLVGLVVVLSSTYAVAVRAQRCESSLPRAPQLDLFLKILQFTGWMLICYFAIGELTVWGGVVLGVCSGGLVGLFLYVAWFDGNFPLPTLYSAMVFALCILPIAGAISTPYLLTEWQVHNVLCSKNVRMSNEAYFRTVVDVYPRLCGSYPHLCSYCRRDPNGLYRIDLFSDLGGEDMVKNAGDLGKFARNESSSQMALVLSLVAPRCTHCDRIDYDARTTDDNKETVEYRVTINPADYAVRGSQYASIRKFIDANKRILKDTASGKGWYEH